MESFTLLVLELCLFLNLSYDNDNPGQDLELQFLTLLHLVQLLFTESVFHLSPTHSNFRSYSYFFWVGTQTGKDDGSLKINKNGGVKGSHLKEVPYWNVQDDIFLCGLSKVVRYHNMTTLMVEIDVFIQMFTCSI